MMPTRAFTVHPIQYVIEKAGKATVLTQTAFQELYFKKTGTKRATPERIMAWYRTNGFTVTKRK